ncbi:hypothetical protein Bca52824_004236 [Brassica carinata]|uniref:Uncharacterized protein n=1 Tax=Brassica carinata TaxID=52824 RepID=A0A8X7WNL2_BRACI|nr:hypothetical protein Bca52824_004236 [Brassica carinata]
MQNGRYRGLEERVLLKAEESDIVLEAKMQNPKESDEDSLVEMMMVNKALEVEKQMAENKAEEWKRKFEKLAETVRKLDEVGALRVGDLELDEDVKVGLELGGIKFPLGKKKTESLCREGLANHQVSGCTPYVTTPVKEYMSGRNRDDVSSRRRVNKMLVFEGDGGKSVDVVDISDGETEERLDGKDALEERSAGEEEYVDEDVGACEVDANTARKRKRVITSDSENDDDDDDDDNIPIATLKNLKPQNHEVVDAPSAGEGLRRQRRASSRLRKQRPLEEIFTCSEGQPTERLGGIPITGNADDDENDTEEESESDSLNGFIVTDESASEEGSDDTEDGNAPEEGSDGEADYADVIARLRRDKKPGEHKWTYETDMLAAFGKDPELCMRAVCVLYRFQTEDEKATRSSHVANGRGFSMFDADRGTRLGQFLTDGDPEGDLKKSVEELQSFMFDAVEICRDLAVRYSKQLFLIYNNREVPFFAAPPSS